MATLNIRKKGHVVPRSWGRRRNALLMVACCVVLARPAEAARVGAESHLGPRRAIPCAYSPAAQLVWETNSPTPMAKKEKEPITHVKQWMRLFEGSALYKHEPSRLLEDYLDMTLCAVSNGQQEAKYLKVAGRYSRQELTTISELFAMHVLIHEHQVKERGTDGKPGWYDMLGDIYMELASRSKASRMGQFFTPVEVCDVMAQLTFDMDPGVAVGKTAIDPACGSGRTLLALHALQPKMGLLYGADLDPICAKMCALNFWLHGIRGEVACMNSLSQQWYFAYHTHPRYTWPFVTHLHEDRQEESHLYRERATVAVAPVVITPATPDLFTAMEPRPVYGQAARCKRYDENEKRQVLGALQDIAGILERNKAETEFEQNKARIALELRLRGAELHRDTINVQLGNTFCRFTYWSIDEVLSNARSIYKKPA
jgi:type I restriction enzyme M protein